MIQPLIGEALLGEGGAEIIELFGVTALPYPAFPQARQTETHIDDRMLITVGTRGVVDGDRLVGFELRVLLAAPHQSVGQGNFAQPHPDIGARTFDKDAAGVGMGHPLEIVDKTLGTGTLLAAADGD